MWANSSTRGGEPRAFVLGHQMMLMAASASASARVVTRFFCRR